MNTNLQWLTAVLLLSQLWACSKKDTRPEMGNPGITFNTTTGEYKVKTGKDLTLSATVRNATAPVYAWKLDGRIIGTDLQCPFPKMAIGEYFVTFRVDAANGSTEQQVKVTVVDKLPPQIDMPLNMVAYQGRDNKLAAAIANSDGARYAWRLDGTIVGSDSIYTLNPSKLGSSSLTLKVWNDDGEDLKVATLVILPPPAPQLFFDDGRYLLPNDVTTRRISIPLGKSLVLAPVIANMTPVSFQWAVDGTAQPATSVYFTFTPSTKATYLITVTAGGLTAKINVECVAPEGTYIRTSGSTEKAVKVFEFTPAPGQFIDYQQGSTAEQARQDIQNAMDFPVSIDYIAGLGAYGGYFITGFDHSVKNVEGKADLRIGGNAFPNWSEPGIVWVMQDENGNGLPDDTWYELKGSETGRSGTRQRYAITYFKPSSPGSDVLWIDNFGGTGSVDYNQYHTQPYYFPMFINADAYTLTGTCLKSTMAIGALETSAGYPWGYVDNYGDGSKSDFWIEDAIRADGTPVNLTYIDFVKVQTGMTGKGAAVGEISTEAGVPIDLNFSN